ncbi:endonuclease/exonuclease/phosphatase family protein [Paenibacillus sp.]|jgi:endonuclease/exonuclease/phosphatase family metal-dependent hydrolase|uniref:endonuclease/exonuclease/phosphatase family protein n=1 Tax=Paenibacillus sp. TaxID=58172 RepID=UPI002835CE1F|nr:endonuclease/exonuclease/phosphatase family protein [Paenibacillus sp.]MDR0269273.1 endonuclease/exonuclease/phosphatase family protein [Paenibacillus sp.]
MVKKILWALGSIILAAVLLFGGFLLYVTVTDYKPKPTELVAVTNNPENILKQASPFIVTTFNIGYAGLDETEDFFMDGGTHSRSYSKINTLLNLNGIGDFLSSTHSDMIFIQEVDVKSSRSYDVNEVGALQNLLPDYSFSYADNYKVPWVPVPLLHPMGHVQSGIMTFSKFKSTAATRFDLPGKESWPRQQFDLDRAFIENRIPVDNGKELVLVNLHLSAFDKGGSIRKQQLQFLGEYIEKEMEKGNYLILGGDWNHSLPGTDPKAFKTTQDWPEWLQPFPENFKPEGFQWAVDKNTPSVRTVDVPYQEGVNFRAVIDGFLVSPNVEIVKVQGHDLKHKFSDHNPVTAEFRLK